MPINEHGENRPRPTTSQLSEPLPFPAVLQDEIHTVKTKVDERGTLFVQIEHEEVVIFSAAVTRDHKVQLRYDAVINTAPPANITPIEPVVQPTELATSQQEQKTQIAQETQEKEKPVKMRGNIGTEIKRKTSPTGGNMAVFAFAEHPLLAEWSYYNQQPDDEKPRLNNKTVWRNNVAAFDENTGLLEGITTGQTVDLTCYKRSWKEETDTGKQKTVKGFVLVGLQPVVKRTRKEPTT